MSIKKPILPYHPEGRARRISKQNEQGILRFAQNDKKGAFTLAEVLITLGIIGIVIALTLPSIIGKYQRKVTAEKLKVAYNIFSSALERAKNDYGELYMTKDMYIDPYLYRKTYIDPYLKEVKSYKGNYIIISASNGSGAYLYYNKDNADTGNGAMCLPNGFCYFLKRGGGYNSDTDYGWVNYMYIIVDLNGPRKPNRVGHDVFYFALNVPSTLGATVKKVPLLSGYVHGTSAKTSRDELIKDCRGDTSDWGAGSKCTLLIMNDGWEIRNDYPW